MKVKYHMKNYQFNQFILKWKMEILFIIYFILIEGDLFWLLQMTG